MKSGDLTFPKIKEKINKAGNLFYQYRAFRRDAATIYDIENIHHRAVYCNKEWNYSAPHGAGRVMSRSMAKQTVNMEEYKAAMEGIYTTSVNESTLDEAPMVYKSLEDIIDVVRESVDLIDVIKPVFNFKAADDAAPWKKKKDETCGETDL